VAERRFALAAALASALSDLHRVRATMARCSTRGPCAAVSRGRQAAKRASAWTPMPFRQDRSPVEKPGPGSRTCRAGCPASAKRGGLSLWLAFSLATQRESNSCAEGARKLLLQRRSRISRNDIWERLLWVEDDAWQNREDKGQTSGLISMLRTDRSVLKISPACPTETYRI
jgi:hypothetical protein